MARIQNLFAGDTAEPVEGIGLWSISDATTRVETEQTPINVTTMMHIIPDNISTPVVLSLTDFSIPDIYRASSVDFGFYIKSEARIDILVNAQNPSPASTASEPDAFLNQTQNFVPVKGTWVFPRVARISTGTRATAQFITITITISNHGGNAIYFARPILVPTFFHLLDAATIILQSQVPQDIIDIDESVTPLVAGVARLLHIMGCGYQDVLEEFFDISNRDHIDSYNEGDEEFSSTLVNPLYVNTQRARWLAQFIGASLIDSSNGLTPWANLPKTWAEWAAQIDTADVGTTVEWFEIESFNTELIGLQTYFRWQLSTGAYSQNGGTFNAIKAAAQNVLTGTKTVNISSRTSNPFTIYVTTLALETDAIILSAALYAAKPVGFSYNFSTI